MQFVTHLIHQGPQTAGFLEVLHAVLTVGPDSNEQWDLSAGSGIDFTAVDGESGLGSCGRDVDDGISAAADGLADLKRIFNGLIGDDLTRRDTLLHQLHDSLATGLSQFQHFGGTGCRSGIAGQAHADAFTHQSHGVCCAHHPTGAAARAGAADQFVQLLFRNLSIEIACTGRGDVDKVHIFTVQNGGFHVAACENDTGNIHAAGGHQHGRDNFVAGSDEHGTI